jgi:hypothetical protein
LVLFVSIWVCLSSCGAAGLADSGLKFAVASLAGPLAVTRISVLADSSLSGLIGLVDATESRPTFADCQQHPVQIPKSESCWDSLVPPTNTLFIALKVRVGCYAGKLTEARLASTRLTLSVAAPSQGCMPGAGTRSEPNYTLVTIPLAELPRALIIVTAKFSVGNGPATQLGDNALVDVREPQIAADTVSRLDAAVNAINRVKLDAVARFGEQVPLSALSIRRFGSSPSCDRIESQGNSDASEAFVMTLRTQSPGNPANGATYIAFADRIIYCAKAGLAASRTTSAAG